MATTIHFLYPILVAAIMIMFFKERKSLSIIGFSLLAFFGIGLLSWSNGHIDRLGLISAFLSIITYSIYMVGIKKMSLDKSSPEIIAFYVLFIGTVIFFVSALCTTGLKLPNNIQAWLYLVVLAIFPTVIADLLLIYAINKYTGPTISSALGVMEPVVIVIIGSLFLSESLSLRGVLGIMLILSSVIMVIIKSSKGQSY
jgi:drug/metabolite transporter (DMT)-like permease